MGKKVQFAVDSLEYDGIYDDYSVFNTWYDECERMLIVLVGPEADSKKYRNSTTTKDYGDWIHHRPRDDKYHYAVGSAPEYYYVSSSWKKALTGALEEMAEILSAEIKSLNKEEITSFDEHRISNYYRVSDFEGDYELRNWQVAARKIETIAPGKKIYNVLIKMPKLQ